MKQYVEVEVAENVTILVETELPPGIGPTPTTGAGEKTVARASETFAQSLTKVRAMATTALNALRESAPDEMELEFGLKLGAKAGVVIAAADAEVAVKVTLKWTSQANAAPNSLSNVPNS